MKIYNGEEMLLGRLASVVAKDLLLGETVNIVNCEKVLVSGHREKVLANEKQKRERKGYPLKSANFSRLPDRFVRRTVRGMLPWKKPRGKEVFANLMCYMGVPEEFKDKELITIKTASVKKLPTLKYVDVGDVCKSLGWKGLKGINK